MSIHIINSAALKTAVNSVIGVGQAKASVAFSLRINGPLPLTPTGWTPVYLLARSGVNGFGVQATSIDAAAQTMTLTFLWRADNGAAVTKDVVIVPEVVYCIAMTYNKDDPSSQAVYVNGVKYLMTNPQAVVLHTAATSLEIGNTNGGTINRNWSIEDVVWRNGYVWTFADVFALMKDDTDRTTIGMSGSTWGGYWSMRGTTGGTPTTGDGALANQIGDHSWALSPSVNGAVAGSSLVYEAAMPFVSQAVYDAPIVCSSGKSIRVPTKSIAGKDLVVTSFGDSSPTIKINGGAAVTLGRSFSTSHYGAMFFLPSGSKINAGDSVAFSASDGFVATILGAATGCTDMACVNKSGVAIYGDQPRTLFGGHNQTYPAETNYSWYQGSSNWAHRLLVEMRNESPSTVRGDGTIKADRSQIWLVQTTGSTDFDSLGYPMPLGKWVLSYIPKDAGRATNLWLSSAVPGCCAELTDYRNNGSVAGDRVIKVFDVFTNVTYPNTLVADVNASTTSIPLANSTNIQGLSMIGNPLMWLKIDDEYMAITAINTTTKVATVIRGDLGSTPASHANGTACVSSWYSQNPNLKLNIAGPSGVPNYSDVVIYCPADWTPPATATPVTDLDTSLTAQLRPTKFVRDSMPNCGVVRFMDSTGSFQQVAEPEYMREVSDLYWGQDSKFFRDFRWTSFKSFDPTDTPYVYYHRPYPGAETYTATLASSIDAVQTTITISDAATAPVIQGSRLQIDSEWMRVVDVSGTTVTVARGCVGTTAASHSSGTITVGWRLPIASASSIYSADAVAVDITCDQPHGLRSGMWCADPDKIDMNPLARGTVTLAAPASAGDTSITLTASDWTYITTGMYIQFGSDPPFRLASANSGTGVCTLDYPLAKSYSSGTVGATMACGVWTVSTDGTTHAWSPNQAVSCWLHVLGANRLLCHFYVKLGGKPGLVVGTQTWDQTPAGSGAGDASQVHWKQPISLYPYEYPPRVSAQAPGCIHWINIPPLASDDLVWEIARRTRDNLPSGAGHKVVVELANEVWNLSFAFNGLYNAENRLSGGFIDNWVDPWILRTKAVHQIVKDVFAATGHDAPVLLSLPFQTGAIAKPLIRARALGVDVDVCSSAPYYKPAYTATACAVFEASDDDQCIDAWLFDFECNATTGEGKNLRDVDSVSRTTHETLTGRPLQYITYEGGFTSMLPLPPNGTNDVSVYANGVTRNLDLSYNPTLYLAMQDMLSACQRWGLNGFNFFTHCQWPGKVSYGNGFYHEMWGLTPYHGQPAGRGDGSDGKADNRLCLATPGKANTKGRFQNYHGTNVSVRLQALLDWNAARANPEPEEHDPLPKGVYVPIIRRRARRPLSFFRIPKEHSVVPPPALPPIVNGRRVIVFRNIIS